MSHNPGRDDTDGCPNDADRSAAALAGCAWSAEMQNAYDLLPEAVFLFERQEMTIRGVNRAACERTGYTRDELLGLGLRRICPSMDTTALVRRLSAPATGGAESAAFSTVERRKDGTAATVEWHVSPIPESNGKEWIVLSRETSAGDGADALCRSRAEPYGLGLPGHDPLTGLPDRRLFERLLDRAMERAARRNDYLFAVCFIDLDGFKAINDRFGHLAGDRVLCEVARRLVGCVRSGDVAARFGGDEFTVLIDDLHDRRDASMVARRILDQIRRPIAIDDHSVQLTASIGVAVSTREYRRREDLLHDADRAMYGVKSQGGDGAELSDDNHSFRPIEPR